MRTASRVTSAFILLWFALFTSWTAMVDLSDAPGAFAAEWHNVNTGVATPAPDVEGGTVHTFSARFDGPVVLYLSRRAESGNERKTP